MVLQRLRGDFHEDNSSAIRKKPFKPVLKIQKNAFSLRVKYNPYLQPFNTDKPVKRDETRQSENF